MFKLLHNCMHFTCYQGNAPNPTSQASAVCELRNSQCMNWIQERQRNERSNCKHPLDHRKGRKTSASLTTLKCLTVWITINCEKILKEIISDFIVFSSRITVDADCTHEVKRLLLLGRKAMTHLDSILKSRDITLPTKVCIVKAVVFPVVMYGCESWTVKKAER